MDLLGPPKMQAFPLFCHRCGEAIRIIAFVTLGIPFSVLSNVSVIPSNPRRLPPPPIHPPGGGTPLSAKSLTVP